MSGATLWCYAKHAWPGGCFDFDTSPWGYVSRDRKKKMKAFSVVRNMFRERAELIRKRVLQHGLENQWGGNPPLGMTGAKSRS